MDVLGPVKSLVPSGHNKLRHVHVLPGWGGGREIRAAGGAGRPPRTVGGGTHPFDFPDFLAEYS